jgi:hypothetical protein
MNEILQFILGFIAGIVVFISIAVILIYFRKVIDQKLEIIKSQIELKGPRPKGFIIEPESEADEARSAIIAKNNAQGKPTKLSELHD